MEAAISDIKYLRSKTEAGMQDCRRALAESEGDREAAERLLKEWGLAAVQKRADREAREGSVFIHEEGASAAMVELVCETDFVSRNDLFRKAGAEAARHAWAARLGAPDPKLAELAASLASVMKENIQARRVAFMAAGPSGLVVSYLHGEGALGVLLRLGAGAGATAREARVLALAHDLALHIAAYRPLFLDEASIPAAYREERLALIRKEVEEDPAAQAKSEAIREGMVAGRLRKHFAAICLLGHAFVKDEARTVAELLADFAAETGFAVTVEGFASFRAGEA
jgi:elongation factor Ts